LNHGFLFVGKEGTITFIFKHFPLIRKYKDNGDLISEQYIKNEMFKEKESYNKDMNSKRPDTMAAYIEITHYADSLEGKLYLFDDVSPRIWIREIDENGQINKTYWGDVGDIFSESAFKVRREKGRLKFYVLQSSPEAKVLIFGEKH
jgi:hypothetical protein